MGGVDLNAWAARFQCGLSSKTKVKIQQNKSIEHRIGMIREAFIECVSHGIVSIDRLCQN